MESKYAKLVMVTAENNNKYYEMIYEGGNDFTIKYGRIDLTCTTLSKPIKEWNSIYNSKVKKGYKDVTSLVAATITETENKEEEIETIADKKVDQFLKLMKSYTDGLVTKTYTVKYENVSEKQINEAQDTIDKLVSITKNSKFNEKEVNDLLLHLYGVIPRHMKKVQYHLLPSIDIQKTLIQEQDNLDAISSQVSMYKSENKSEDKKDKVVKKSLLDILELNMKEGKNNNELDYLIKQLSGKKIEAIFEVNKDKENKIFENWVSKANNKNTRILIHGTRCTSVIPILKEGLKIRPSGNFQFSGKVYGDGNYFSEVTNKSLNYTGYDNDQILLVYEVHTGNPYIYNGWYNGNSFTLSYNELSKRGYDSTYVKAGGGLLNSEIIAYHEHQNRIKYIIWLKR